MCRTFPSNIWGLYDPNILEVYKIFDDVVPMYLGAVDPENISVKYLGIVHWGCKPHPSNILGLYTPKKFAGYASVKYLGAVDPQNISRMWFHPIFWGL